MLHRPLRRRRAGHHQRTGPTDPSPPARRRRERGSVSLLLATALVFAALAGYGVARLGATEARAAAAQAAADASALAGAEDGRPGAEAVARRNGAELVSFLQDHLDVQVTVVRQGHRATARARWLPRGVTG